MAKSDQGLFHHIYAYVCVCMYIYAYIMCLNLPIVRSLEYGVSLSEIWHGSCLLHVFQAMPIGIIHSNFKKKITACIL